MTMMCCGTLRCLGLRLARLTGVEQEQQTLAGKSTLNRLEQAMHIEQDLSGERYVK